MHKEKKKDFENVKMDKIDYLKFILDENGTKSLKGFDCSRLGISLLYYLTKGLNT